MRWVSLSYLLSLSSDREEGNTTGQEVRDPGLFSAHQPLLGLAMRMNPPSLRTLLFPEPGIRVRAGVGSLSLA